jgi:hypothetical protein
MLRGHEYREMTRMAAGPTRVVRPSEILVSTWDTTVAMSWTL